MALTRRRLLVALPFTVAIAGCIGDDDDADTPTPTPTPTPSPTPTPLTGDVNVADHPELGEILVDAEGITLYNFDQDEQGAGESTCYDDCAGAWPPLIVDDDPVAGEGVTADVTAFERGDGELQVAADGWPLYYFVQDEEPGDVTGHGVDGFGDFWWVVRPDGTVVREEADDDDDDDDGSGPGY